MRPLLLIVVLASTAVGEEQRMTVRLSEVESLRLEANLPELLGRVQTQLGEVDRPEALRRRWLLLHAYFGHRAGLRELELAEEKLGVLRDLEDLHGRLAADAAVSDMEWLRARNAHITQELGVLGVRERTRTHLLEIMELCNVQLVTDEDHETPPATGLERPGE